MYGIQLQNIDVLIYPAPLLRRVTERADPEIANQGSNSGNSNSGNAGTGIDNYGGSGLSSSTGFK